MKKILFVVAALAMIAAGAFATDLSGDALALKAEIAASASFTFGYNLETAEHGIKNDQDADVTLTLISSRTHEQKGEAKSEGVYAVISIADIKVWTVSDEADDETNIGVKSSVGDITAKIFLGPVYLNVLGVSGEIDKVAVPFVKLAPDSPVNLAMDHNLVSDQVAAHQGFAIGLVDESVITLEVGVSSVDYALTDAVADDDNVNDYNFYVALGLKAVENLDLGVAFNMSTADGSYIGLGANVGYKIVVAEGYSVKPSVAVDMQMIAKDSALATLANAGDAFTVTEIGGGVLFAVPGEDLADTAYFGRADDLDISSGLNVGVRYLSSSIKDSTTEFNLGATLYTGTLISEDINLIGYFDMGSTDDTVTVLPSMSYGVAANATFDIITVGAQFWSIDENTDDDATADLYVKLTVDVTPIDLVTLTLAYTADSYTKGLVEFTTKVSF